MLVWTSRYSDDLSVRHLGLEVITTTWGDVKEEDVKGNNADEGNIVNCHSNRGIISEPDRDLSWCNCASMMIIDYEAISYTFEGDDYGSHEEMIMHPTELLAKLVSAGKPMVYEASAVSFCSSSVYQRAIVETSTRYTCKERGRTGP